MADAPLSQPTPRRYFDLNSTDSSPPTSRRADLFMLESDQAGEEPRRSGSALNLTSSTLFGIYSHAGDESGRTPIGTGAQTPRLFSGGGEDRFSSPPLFSKPVLPKVHVSGGQSSRPSLFLRFPLLFICGMAYGAIITHLHDDQHLAPVKVDHIDRYSWRYLIIWGTAGVILGGLLPWMDLLLGDPVEERQARQAETPKLSAIEGGEAVVRPNSSYGSANWNQTVRGIGAFVGIAFAIVSTFSLLCHRDRVYDG